MRTTLIIEDTVFKRSKKYAIENGLSLSQLTTQALREVLREYKSELLGTDFKMPVYGGGETRDTSPEAIASIRDA